MCQVSSGNSALVVNTPLFLGRLSKPCKGLLKTEWVQRATKISTVSGYNGSDNGLICLCQEGIWFQEIQSWMLFVHLFIFSQWSESHQSEGEGSHMHEHTLTHTHTYLWNTQLHIHSACTTHQIYTKAMWQHCPCLAPLSCPSHSHRAVTLVSSSCTLLESQHLSRDGLTLLSDIL